MDLSGVESSAQLLAHLTQVCRLTPSALHCWGVTPITPINPHIQ